MTYDVQSYLLDRALIHDVVTSLTLFLDLNKFDELATHVLAEKVEIDYKSVLGTNPYIITGKEQAEMWRGMVSGLDGGQHVTTSLLIDLPYPGEGVERPEKVGVVGNVLLTLVRGGERRRNGGRYVIEVIRTEQEGNPWRICKLKADLVWEDGKVDILDQAGEVESK